MRNFVRRNNEFASIYEFRNAMNAIAEGPAPAVPQESLGEYALRRLIENATRPIREVKEAHATPQPPLLPEMPEGSLTQLTFSEIQLRAAHDLGTIVHPFKRG